MSEKEIKDMIEPIPNWEFTYRYDCSRTCGKSYTQSLLDEKDKKIKDLQQKVEQQEKEIERLNNIINELEKDSIAFKKLNAWIVNRHAPDLFHKMEIIDKLKELNDSD